MEQETYVLECEFIFSSYLPKKIETGMSFIRQNVALLLEPELEFKTIVELPENVDEFMKINGAPVTYNLISVGEKPEIVALREEIGLFEDENEDLFPITDHIINVILNNYAGRVNVQCDETGDVILYEGKVIISYISDPENEEEQNQ